MRLEEYVSCLEREIRDRSGLTELLEHSELYYDAQYGEARIVTNVRFSCFSIPFLD